MLINAALLVRMSTDKQDTSIEQQIEQCSKAFASKYQFVLTYTDIGKSGSKNVHKRKQFLKMLDDAIKPDFPKVIVCLDLSRLDRLDSIKGGKYIEVLKDNGIVIDTVLDGRIDLNTTSGRLIKSVKAELNHETSVRIAQKSLNGRIDKLRRKQFIGGKVPYAYQRQVTDERGKSILIPRRQKFATPKTWVAILVPGDKNEIKVVQWIFEQFVTRDVSARQLGIELNAQGIKNMTGIPWTSVNVLDILHNPAYIGQGRIGDQQSGAFYRVSKDEKMTEIIGKRKTDCRCNQVIIEDDCHEVIIDLETWNDAVEKLSRNRKLGSSSQGEGYCLTGVLFCGKCQSPMMANAGKQLKEGRHIRYYCQNASANPSMGCKFWSISEKTILPFIISLVVEKYDSLLIEQLEAKPILPPSADLETLRARMAKLTQKAYNVRESITETDDKETRKGLLVRLSEIEEEKRQAEDELKRLSIPQDTERQEKAKWWARMRSKLISIPTGQVIRTNSPYGHYSRTNLETGETIANPGYGYESTLGLEVEVTPAVLREALKQIGLRVELWWAPAAPRGKEKGRWVIDWGQVKVGFGDTATVNGLQSLPRQRPQTSNHDLPPISLVFTGADLLAFSA